MNRHRVTDLGNRIYKTIRKLRPQHRRKVLSIALKSLAERIARAAALGIYVACPAAIDRRIAERIASESLQKLRHRRRGCGAEENDSYSQYSIHLTSHLQKF